MNGNGLLQRLALSFVLAFGFLVAWSFTAALIMETEAGGWERSARP